MGNKAILDGLMLAYQPDGLITSNSGKRSNSFTYPKHL